VHGYGRRACDFFFFFFFGVYGVWLVLIRVFLMRLWPVAWSCSVSRGFEFVWKRTHPIYYLPCTQEAAHEYEHKHEHEHEDKM